MTDAPHTDPVPRPRAILCPYCGDVSPDPRRCVHCHGLFEPLSRQATQNAMGPWFIRDPANPFRPGCSYQTLCALVRAGKVTPATVLRGPTTRQFWTLARRTPGIAHLFGLCHSCQHQVDRSAAFCPACGASFTHEPDRQFLGLGPIRLLPGKARPEAIASSDSPAPAAPSRHPAPNAPPPAGAQPRSAMPVLIVVLLTAAATFLASAGVYVVWLRDAPARPAALDPPVPPTPAEPSPDPTPTNTSPSQQAEPDQTPNAEKIEPAATEPAPAGTTETQETDPFEGVWALIEEGRLDEAQERLDAVPGDPRTQRVAEALATLRAIRDLGRLP